MSLHRWARQVEIGASCEFGTEMRNTAVMKGPTIAEGLFIGWEPVDSMGVHLQVVLEHITTRDAADFVTDGPDTLAATVTPQHVLMNRNALFLVPSPSIAQYLTSTKLPHAPRNDTTTFASTMKAACDPADADMRR